MRCDQFLAWLLGSPTLQELPADVKRHVQMCPQCRRQWQRLIRLESALAAGFGVPETHGLEDFLGEHGFAQAAAVPVSNAPTPPTLSLTDPAASRAAPRRADGRWLLPIAVLSLVVGTVIVWLGTIGFRTEEPPRVAEAMGNADSPSPLLSSPAEQRTASRGQDIHASSPTAAMPSESLRAANPGRPLETKPTPASSALETTSHKRSSLDTVRLVSRARLDAQALWGVLCCSTRLVREVSPQGRTRSLGELGELLGEEALRHAQEERLDHSARFVQWLERCGPLLVRLAERLAESERPRIISELAGKYSALAAKARATAPNHPAAVAARLCEVATAAEGISSALRQLAPTGQGLPSTEKSSLATPADQNESMGLSQGERISDSMLLRANAMRWHCVVFMEGGETEEQDRENATAYLLLSSVREDLMTLAVERALQLAEEGDPLVRIQLSLDLAEGVLRALAVTCAAGPSAVSQQLALQLDALLTGTVEANWPAWDLSPEATTPTRREAWRRLGQRLSDLLLVLEMGQDDLPVPVQAAWQEALEQMHEGIAALEAAVERGLPEPGNSPKVSPRPTTPTTRSATAPATKPATKPTPLPPRKPDKPKVNKPPFKPSKPFPERFKDLKDLWHSKKP